MEKLIDSVRALLADVRTACETPSGRVALGVTSALLLLLVLFVWTLTPLLA